MIKYLTVKDLKSILNQFDDEDNVVILSRNEHEHDKWEQKIVTQVAGLESPWMDNHAIALHSTSDIGIDISVAATDFKEILFDKGEELE